MARQRFIPSPEIGFEARVSADRLRFAATPEVSVEFPGDEHNRSFSGSARRNLPRPVAAGTAYRHPRIHYLLASRIDLEPAPGDVEAGESGTS